ncbi:MAG: glycerol-3-phosphate acyltransferase [Anaerolineae bacterium]|nr:MAG: glycerol-3-phosphate acyltransferase [Anaerolineae bacterium]
MQYALYIVVLLLSYLIGAIPMGYIMVKLTTGQDVRRIQSGRTGATNAMRAAGFWVGLATSLADVGKGMLSVWLARNLVSLTPWWLEVLAPVVVIFGHNYSIFTLSRDEQGRLRIGGGAGGAPSVGGAAGLWWPMLFILVPLGALILFGVGYASVATMSVPLLAALIFAWRAYLGLSPWYYLWYCFLAEILILWALRPNIRRLMNGTERGVGWRAKRQKARQAQQQD